MSDEESTSAAGLSFAPAYDKSREFDPSRAEVIPTKETVHREDFDFFRKRMEKQAAVGRMVLVVVLLIAVGANILLTLRTQEIVIHNVDQARQDQAQLDEGMFVKVTVLEEQIAALSTQLDTILQAHPFGPPDAESD